MGPVQLFSHKVEHATLARLADRNEIMAELHSIRYRKAGTAYCDALLKEEALTITLSWSTMK